jgi:hypothetical protein
VIVLVLNLIAAAAVLEFERGNPHQTLPECVVVAVTITTVGYDDRFPMSPAGRGGRGRADDRRHRVVQGHHRCGRDAPGTPPVDGLQDVAQMAYAGA